MNNVLITGANKGIGFETARQLADAGYRVFLGSRDREKGLLAVSKLRAAGFSHVEAIEIDVTDSYSIKRAKETLASKIDVLDVLINNAAIVGEQPQNLVNCDIEILRKVFEANFFGVVQTTQQFIPMLEKSRKPLILNISSEVGSLALHTGPERKPNWDFYHAYGASETALNAFTVMLANALADTAIKVNSVTPGYTATGLNDFKGTQTPEQAVKPIIKLINAVDNRPTGKFFKEGGEVPW